MLATSHLRYLTLGDKDMNKSVKEMIFEPYQFSYIMGTDSIMDWDYYCL